MRTFPTVLVRARPGVRVPREGSPRQYITEDSARPVPLSPYYQRQLEDGDLVLVSTVADKPSKQSPPSSPPSSTPQE